MLGLTTSYHEKVNINVLMKVQFRVKKDAILFHIDHAKYQVIKDNFKPAHWIFWKKRQFCSTSINLHMVSGICKRSQWSVQMMTNFIS
jgi:hypothetical protein